MNITKPEQTEKMSKSAAGGKNCLKFRIKSIEYLNFSHFSHFEF